MPSSAQKDVAANDNQASGIFCLGCGQKIVRHSPVPISSGFTLWVQAPIIPKIENGVLVQFRARHIISLGGFERRVKAPNPYCPALIADLGIPAQEKARAL